MKITVLGTGTSSGVPVLTCECPVCTSLNPKDQRLRVSILVQDKGNNILIDSGPDFRQQVLKTGIKDLAAVVFTHEHKDHTAGLDDVRPFNYLRGKDFIDIYARSKVLHQLKREFHYAFETNPYPGAPKFETHKIKNRPFLIGHTKFIPIEVMHHKLPVFGYRIGSFAYITDAKTIEEKELKKLKGVQVLILNALQKSPHISHLTLEEAIEIARKVNAHQTYFTHISHKMGLHEEVNASLPKNMALAYDGLQIEI